MAKNYGKDFEQKFKEDFLKMPDASLDRLYDVVNGYRNIKQICDFIGYLFPNIFYLECKSCRGASISFDDISQYDRLKTKVGKKGVRSGVVLWLIDKDKVLYIPTSTITKLKEEGEKSVGIRHLDKFRIIEIPSNKKRVFMDSDYSILADLQEGD